MELGLQEGVKAPALENDAHGLGTVTVGLEILIRESIWHLCIRDKPLSCIRRGKKEMPYQLNRAIAHEVNANVILSSVLII